MTVIIHKDEYGIQLVTSYQTKDHILDLFDVDDVEEIKRACEKWLSLHKKEWF